MPALIPVFTGDLAGTSQHLVDARQLHDFLEVGSFFAHWIQRRIDDYGFIEDEDYKEVLLKNEYNKEVFAKFGKNHEPDAPALQAPDTRTSGGRPAREYHCSLDMAKELAMVERTPRGREARRYFIRCERELLQRQVNTQGEDARAPMLRPDPHLLREYRLLGKGLAQAYLVETGVTPAHVAGLLATAGTLLSAGDRPDTLANPVPVAELKKRLPRYATSKRDGWWYFLRQDFARVCEGYDMYPTLDWLLDNGLLRRASTNDRYTIQAPRRMFSSGRPQVYCISQALERMEETQHG